MKEPSEALGAGRGTIQLLVARLVFLAHGFFISIILARGLGPIDLGIYGVVMSVLAWTEVILSAGIPGATASLIPRHESGRPAVEQTARVLLLVVSIFLFFVFWSLAPLLAAALAIPSGTAVFRIASLDIPLIGIVHAYGGILNGRRMFKAQGSLLIVQSLAKLLGILLLLAWGLSVSGVFVVHVVATLATVLYIVGRFPPDRSLPNKRLVSSMVRIALPMSLYTVALQILLNLSLWQLKGSWKGPGEIVGFYVAGLNLTRVLLIVPAALSGVLFASLSWAFAQVERSEVKRYVQGAGRFALVVVAPACLLLVVNAEGLMTLLYGDSYRGGATILATLAVAFAAMTFLDVLSHALMASGRFRLPAGILVGLIPVLVALNGILIPERGGAGAAAALAIVMCIGALAAAGLSCRHFGAPIQLKTAGRVLPSCLLITLLSSELPMSGPWLILELTAMGVLYVLSLGLLGEIGREDLRAFAVWKAGRG